ncbi:MAG: hypothetical protein ACYTAS_10855 [Planctomycetota bacterium]|jgi:hypothetical protein
MLIKRHTKKLRKFARKTLTRLHDKAMAPPTEEERRLVGELRERFSQLPQRAPGNPATMEQEWLDNMFELRRAVRDQDPRQFLRWRVVSSTMSAKYPEYADPEFESLKARSDWESRWSEAIREAAAGHPLPYYRHPSSSANLIHQAYHVAEFERELHRDITQTKLILEFGGGYGCMCRLLHRLGYTGGYVIFDLPEFSEMQRFYLESVGLNVHGADRLKTLEQGIVCTSDLYSLRGVLANSPVHEGATFIATWSISETPLQMRGEILSAVGDFGNFLIAYQHRFAGIDNLASFEDWRNTLDDVRWHRWEIPHMRGSSYMMGTSEQK